MKKDNSKKAKKEAADIVAQLGDYATKEGQQKAIEYYAARLEQAYDEIGEERIETAKINSLELAMQQERIFANMVAWFEGLREAAMDAGNKPLADFMEYMRQDQQKFEAVASEYVVESVASTPYKDSGLAIVNNTMLAKRLMQPERTGAEMQLGKNKQTGAEAILTLVNGYITPYEKEIFEAIAKFKLEGRVTSHNAIYFTVSDLYRALRHGAGTARPTLEQRQNLLSALDELTRPERRIEIKLNRYLKTWLDFETNGGKFPLIKSYIELYGRNRGQETDELIFLDETPIINAFAERLNQWEEIGQEVKAIQQRKYMLELKEPMLIGGKQVKKRSFATNEDRRKFCKANGIKMADIKTHSEAMRPWTLNEQRISLRAVLIDFVYTYIRSRTAGAPCSNRKPYADILKCAGIDAEHRETRKRAIADIGVILDHLRETVPELKGWTEYTNKGSKKPDGIKITMAKQGG